MNENTDIIMVPPHVKAFMKWGEDDFVSFWENAAIKAEEEVSWFRRWDKPFEWGNTFKWYPGGLTNICHNCVDHNITRGRAGKAAFIYESGEKDEEKVITYGQLLSLVKKYAAALRGLGVKKGDPVAVYMPIGIESVVSMLACARIGAIHVVIFAGFSAKAVADRIMISDAQYFLTQDAGSRRGKKVPLKDTVDEALKMAPGIKKVAVLKTDEDTAMKEGRDISWEDFLELGKGQPTHAEKMEANEPLFMLPTSGTTAMPKVTVQNHGGYQVYVYSMGKWIYNMKETDVWFCTSDIGWIVGHSYNVYGPLLAGCTSVLYEGTPDYPRKDMWWDTLDRNRATAWWVSPTGVRGLMRLGIEQAQPHDLSSVERIFCAGEVLNPAAWRWLQMDVFENRIPVIDHMWQTETSGPLIANPYGLGMIPVKPGSSGLPVPGVAAEVVDGLTGEVLPVGTKGVMVVKNPFPGLTPTLWKNEERYTEEYWNKFEGRKVYYSGDAAYMDKDGYIWFVGRSDEVIKIAAHRIGTIEIENALISHPAVVEVGVSGVPDELRGEVACAFVVLRSDYTSSEDLKKELIQHVRNTMGPIVVIKDIEFVDTLPKTRSGKIMRRVMKSLWTSKDLGDLSTIEEEASIDEMKEAIKKMK
ncbi:MAG: acetate--CoA ligase [Theionarchaea archaeon]|nr:acetate--CoA ligase [Theionarchaea archaeon]